MVLEKSTFEPSNSGLILSSVIINVVSRFIGLDYLTQEASVEFKMLCNFELGTSIVSKSEVFLHLSLSTCTSFYCMYDICTFFYEYVFCPLLIHDICLKKEDQYAFK